MILSVALMLTLDVPRKRAPIRARPYVDYPLLNTLCMTACRVHALTIRHTVINTFLCILKACITCVAMRAEKGNQLISFPKVLL